MKSSRSMDITALRQLYYAVDELDGDVERLMHDEKVAKIVFAVIHNDDSVYNDDKEENKEKLGTEQDFCLLWSESALLEEKLGYKTSFESTFELVAAIINAFGPRKVPEESAEAVYGMRRRLQRLDKGSVTLPMLKSLWPTTESRWLVDRFFRVVHCFWPCEKSSECLSPDSICLVLLLLLSQSDSSKVFFLLGLFDLDHNGELAQSELSDVLVHMMAENGVIFDQHQIRLMVDVLMQEGFNEETIDPIKDELIENEELNNEELAKSENEKVLQFWQLERLLQKTPGLAEAMAASMDEWLVPRPVRAKSKIKWIISSLVPRQFRLTYLVNHPTFAIFALILFCVVFSVSFIRALQFVEVVDKQGRTCWPVITARGSGGAINVCSVILLLLMSRPLLTLLRAKGLSRYLPLDHHIFFHKTLAITLMIAAIVHSVSHLVNLELNFANSDNFEQFLRVNNMSNLNIVSNLTYWQWLLTPDSQNFGLIPGFAYLTGVLLVIICLFMSLGSLPFIRAKGYFELFYFTHLLYLLFFVALLVHSPVYWQWLLLPGSVFALGKLYSGLNLMGGKTHVVCGVLLPSQVLQLVIRRKSDFEFRCGDYVFLKVPFISRFEWHPFTISSAPEQTEIVTMHIRAVGNWTRQLQSFFQQENQRITQERDNRKAQRRQEIELEQNKERLETRNDKSNNDDEEKVMGQSMKRGFVRVISRLNLNNSFSRVGSLENSMSSSRLEASLSWHRDAFTRVFGPEERLEQLYRFLNRRPLLVDRPLTRHSKRFKPLEVFMAGPYGAPTSDLFNAQHALIVATGIGVTPFASVLQSIVRRRLASPQSLGSLSRVDFVWVNREQRSFEWFLQLLSQLEMEQEEQLGHDESQHLLYIHLYVTSMGRHHEYKAAVLNLALDLMHKKTKRDLMTGLKARTHSGRPDWDALFNGVQKERRGRVTVFYCGNNALAATMEDKCNKFGFAFKKEIF